MAKIKVEEEELRCKNCNGTGETQESEAFSQGFEKVYKYSEGICDTCGGTGYDPEVPMEKRNTRIRD